MPFISLFLWRRDYVLFAFFKALRRMNIPGKHSAPVSIHDATLDVIFCIRRLFHDAAFDFII